MRNTIVAAVAAFALGGISTGVLLAHAQPPPPPGGPPGGAMGRMMDSGPGMSPDAMGPDGMGAMRRGPWGERMHERHAHRMELMRAFALIYRPEDRKLTPADVQRIAEGFLLWNGNHTWKVLNVKPAGDLIGFDVGTADGSPIASFTMDPKNGHLARKG